MWLKLTDPIHGTFIAYLDHGKYPQIIARFLSESDAQEIVNILNEKEYIPRTVKNAL